MKAKGPFTQDLWQSVEPIFEKIIEHDFVVQLAKGTLDRKSFSHYLSQDVLYLKDDNRALELVSEKAKEPQEIAFFETLAEDGLAIERALHNEFLSYFRVEQAKEKSPVISEYTSFLLNHARHSGYEIAITALLPCFWVYNKVGLEIIRIAQTNNPYQKWIDTYQGAEYEEFTNKFIKIVEKQAGQADKDVRIAMREAFVEATYFELAFFEEAKKV